MTMLFLVEIQVSDITQHGMIDLDIRDIESAGSDWAAVRLIYEEGKNSAKASGELRTLKGFSSSYINSTSKQQEPMAKLGKACWGRFDFGDTIVSAAIDGEDSQFGNFRTGSVASTADARKQIIKKGIKFSIVWLYALHEMESALSKYAQGNYDVINGAPHALDEAWAFYVGSMETGDASTGYGPYIAAEKYGQKMGTYG